MADRFLVDETKGAIQVKLAQDTAAFGTTNRDRATRVADLTGVVRLTQPGLRLQIAQVGGAFADVAVNPDKTFNLSASQLAAAIGTLTDKTYQLTLRLVDASNAVVGSNNFSFTLDTTAPVAAISSIDIGINSRMLPKPKFREHCSKKSIRRRKQADGE